MDGKQADEYMEFTKKFLNTIDIEKYIESDGSVSYTMEVIEDSHRDDYKQYCIKEEADGTLPEIVKEDDPDFSWIFNTMNEEDFVYYVEKRLEKSCMSFERIITTLYWR